jgi:hypothetical protein
MNTDEPDWETANPAARQVARLFVAIILAKSQGDDDGVGYLLDNASPETIREVVSWLLECATGKDIFNIAYSREVAMKLAAISEK